METLNKRLALVAALTCAISVVAAQPIGDWYGTVSNFNGDRLAKVSGGVLSFGAAAHAYEGPIAVAGDVRTINFYPTSQGSKYDLALNYLGTNYAFASLPGRAYDGTTDGSWNYTVDVFDGHVYRLDRDWLSPVLMFSLGGAVSGGITYNSLNGTLLIAGPTGSGMVGEYMMNGLQIGGGYYGLGAITNLAYDVDGTVWSHSGSSLQHFTTGGTGLGSYAAPLGSNDYILGAEINSVPEPATLAALGAGLFGLIARRRASKG